MRPETFSHRYKPKTGAEACRTSVPSHGRTSRSVEDTAPEVPEIPSDILEFAKLVNFEPDAKQIEVLQSRARRGIINGSRQVGKSEMMALLAVHKALTVPKSLILLIGPHNRQASEILAKARAFLEDLGFKPRGDGIQQKSVRFANRSRIVALPGVGERVRSFSAAKLIIIDEAAFVHDRTYKNVRPMLAVSQGDLWLISTPFGCRGFFYKVWSEGGDEWTRFTIKATDCPRIPAAYLEEERRNMTEAEYLQEFFCEFYDANTPLFRREIILRAIDPNIRSLRIL